MISIFICYCCNKSCWLLNLTNMEKKKDRSLFSHLVVGIGMRYSVMLIKYLL